MNFELSEDQTVRAQIWIENVARPAALSLQKSKTRNPTREVSSLWSDGFPYGESVWFAFSDSNGIGLSCKVIYTAGTYKNELDLTEYSEW